MANTTFERIRSTALALEQSERAELAHALLASLNETSETNEPIDKARTGAWDTGRPQRLAQADERSLRMFDRVELKWMVRRHLPLR